MSSSLLLLFFFLLSPYTRALLGDEKTAAAAATAATICKSENFTVVASGGLAAIAGCYERKNRHFVAHGQPIYTKTVGSLEGITYGILGSQGSDMAHGVPRWVIAQIREPGSFAGGVDRGTAAVEVEALVCTAGRDWRTTGSPSTVQDWTCDAEEHGSLGAGKGSASVVCGCSALNRKEATAVHAVKGVYGGGGSGGGGASEHSRVVHRTANIRSIRRASVASATNGTTDVSEDYNSSSNPGISTFPTAYLIVLGLIASLVLCCFFWCFSNLVCKRQPRRDPNVPAEDAAPHAPAVTVQAWGKRQPPK